MPQYRKCKRISALRLYGKQHTLRKSYEIGHHPTVWCARVDEREKSLGSLTRKRDGCIPTILWNARVSPEAIATGFLIDFNPEMLSYGKISINSFLRS